MLTHVVVVSNDHRSPHALSDFGSRAYCGFGGKDVTVEWLQGELPVYDSISSELLPDRLRSYTVLGGAET